MGRSKLKPKSRPARSPATPALAPEAVNAALLQAVELQRDGRLAEAAAVYQAVERSNPDRLEAPHLHAMVEVEQGDLESACARLNGVVRRKPDWVEAQTSLAYVLSELGRWSDAVARYRQALALRPTDTDIQLNLADALEVAGGIDEALTLYRGLTTDPDSRLPALVRIVQIRPTSLSDAEIAEIAGAVVADAVPDRLKIALSSALGEVHEAAADFEKAFHYFALANRLRRAGLLAGADEDPAKRDMTSPDGQTRSLHPDEAAQRHANTIRFVTSAFTPEFLAQYAGTGSHIAAPIFIVGMPRSGSTLIEQILSSHRKVQGVGENSAMDSVLWDAFPYDLSAPNPPGHFRLLAESFLKQIHARGWKSAPRFVDKTLNNYVHVGAISLMFPNSVIINSVRDPVDTCLACYRKQFRTGQENTYDLRDVGLMYVRYRGMMDYWASALPGRVIDVSHEALVADPDAEIRRLITETCRLEWDEACLKFYDTQRPVRTASVLQVRKPIFKTSVERWRRYEKHLGPLFEALGPYAPQSVRAKL